MRVPAQVLRARPLAVLAAVLNGFAVNASLAPDSVPRGGLASAAATVRNVTAAPVRTTLTIAFAGPGAGSSVDYSFVLPPAGTVSIVRRFRIPASAQSGIYTLTVTAANPSGGSARAIATATVG